MKRVGLLKTRPRLEPMRSFEGSNSLTRDLPFLESC